MNAATAVLLSLLVQVGGVDLDRASSAEVAWFRDGELVTQWRLAWYDDGAYRWSGADDMVIVERLRGTDLTYAVVRTDETTPRGAVQEMGVVSLRNLAPILRSLRRGSDAAAIPMNVVSVSWYLSEMEGETTDGASGEGELTAGSATADTSQSAGPDVDERDDTSTTQGRGRLTRGTSGWSATHVATNQVLTLHIRP